MKSIILALLFVVLLARQSHFSEETEPHADNHKHNRKPSIHIGSVVVLPVTIFTKPIVVSATPKDGLHPERDGEAGNQNEGPCCQDREDHHHPRYWDRVDNNDHRGQQYWRGESAANWDRHSQNLRSNENNNEDECGCNDNNEENNGGNSQNQGQQESPRRVTIVAFSKRLIVPVSDASESAGTAPSATATTTTTTKSETEVKQTPKVEQNKAEGKDEQKEEKKTTQKVEEKEVKVTVPATVTVTAKPVEQPKTHYFSD